MGLSQAKRERVTLIAAITPQGTRCFRMYRDTLTAQVLIQFLKRLLRAAGRKVCRVVDKRRVPPSRTLQAGRAPHIDPIELFFRPRYSPKLNPDASLTADLKARMNAAEPVRTGAPRRPKVIAHRRSLQNQPARIRSYFNATPIH